MISVGPDGGSGQSSNTSQNVNSIDVGGFSVYLFMDPLTIRSDMTQTIGSVLMEKRKHKRIQYGRTVNVKAANGEKLQLEVLDYSMGGMGLVSHTPFATGDILDFESIMTLDGEIRTLEMKGEVRHIQEQFQEYSFGVCFL